MSDDQVVEFCVPIGEADWDESQGGWRCGALQIPGAEVTAFYHGGRKADTLDYSVELGIVRWAREARPANARIAILVRSESLEARAAKADVLKLEQERIKQRYELKFKIVGAISAIAVAAVTGWFTYQGKVRGDTSSAVPAPETAATAVVGSIFGRHPDSAKPVAVLIPTENEAQSQSAELMQGAARSVKILTVHGSWLRNTNASTAFELALKRVKVDMVMVDPDGAGYQALDASRQRGFERHFGGQRLGPEILKARLEDMLKLTESYPDQLTVTFHSRYPWIRFTIYDDEKATFVMTPFLNNGKEAPVYYTDDHWLVECLRLIFDDFKSGGTNHSPKDALELVMRRLPAPRR